MEKRYDRPTYPELGHIYPGDYYEAIPWDEYIDPKQPLPEGSVFDIRDYGALPEEDLLNTEAIRRCFADCEAHGGGTVLIAGGRYVSGSVSVPSGCTLFIAPDSALVASRDVTQLLSDDPSIPDDRKGESREGALLHIRHAHDVTVTGGGRICGQGEWYVYEPRELPALTPFPVTMLPRRDQADQINTVPGSVRTFYRDRIRYSEDKYREGKPDLLRPSAMVWVMDSRRVTFRNIILQGSMSWTLHVHCCDELTIRDLVIDDNRHVANADGIDIGSSSHVLVEHCFVSCADDGIVLKAPIFAERMMEDVTVRDCTVLTVMNAFKIGTETGCDIRDVLVERCRFCLPDIYPGSVSGISLESCDGTRLSNVRLRDIEMEGVVCPLYICLEKRNRYHHPYTEDTASPYWGGGIEGVTLERIRAEGCELPCILTGYETKTRAGRAVRKPLRDITVRDMTMVYRDNAEVVRVPPVIEEYLDDYPESNAHGDVPACGLWARHIDGLTVEGFRVTPRSCNTRAEIVTEDVTQAQKL